MLCPSRALPLVLLLVSLSALTGCSRGSKPERTLLPSTGTETLFPVLDSASPQPSIESMMAPLYGEISQCCADSDVADMPRLRAKFGALVLTLQSRLFSKTGGAAIVAELNQAVFQEQGITFDSSRSDPLAILPYTVLERKRGSCLGISLLYLLLAEKLDIPLHGVMVPEHVLARYDDGVTAINIESLKQGEHRDNGWYRLRFGVPLDSLHYLRNLSAREVRAVLAFNLGNYYTGRKDPDRAMACYRSAVIDFPRFAEAWGNLGLAYEGTGNLDKAIACLEKAGAASPGSSRVLQNLGALHARMGEFGRALDAYESARRADPFNPDVLYGLAVCTFTLGDYARAADLAQRALTVRSGFSEAQNLLAQAEARRK